jgi:hypothetical protein
MELLVISVGTDMLGLPSLDCIYGRDVPSFSYSAAVGKLLLQVSAESVVMGSDHLDEMAAETAVMVALPQLLRRLADRVQDKIQLDRKLRDCQGSFFS